MEPMALDVLFEGATILTMVDNAPVVTGDVGVRDGRVVLVGPAPQGVTAKRRIPCRGKLLMPGLVNAHAHTAMAVLRGYADDYPLKTWLFEKVFPAEARLDERAVLAGARLGFAEQLCTGTTSISDMYYHEPAIAQLALEVGMRVSLCNAVVALSPDWSMETDRGVQETLVLAREYQGAGDGLVQAEASIHGEYTSNPRVWAQVAELAQRYDLGIQLHLSETREEHQEALSRNRGKTPAQALAAAGVFEGRVTAAHCVWVSQEDMALLAEKGATAVHCPVSNLKLGSGMADVAALRQAGVNVALGTDGCCSNNTHDLFEEIKLAALLAKGQHLDPTVLSAYDVLKMATVNGPGPGPAGCGPGGGRDAGGPDPAGPGSPHHPAQLRSPGGGGLQRHRPQRNAHHGARPDPVRERGIYHHRFRTSVSGGRGLCQALGFGGIR